MPFKQNYCRFRAKNNFSFDFMSIYIALSYCKQFGTATDMKLFRIPSAEKIGNFILTVVTALISTFIMQSYNII